MSTEETRERVLTFLYGGLTADEEAVFRADLQADPELAQALAEEERFQQRLPVGAGAQVSDRLLDESRMLVRAALRRQADSAPSIRARLSEFFRGMVPQIPQIAYAGGVVAMLLCGILLGRTVLGPSTGPDLAVAPEQVVDIQVKSFDPASGRVRLALSTLSATVLEGSLEDEQVQKVLAAALLGDLEPGPRLQAVELLRDQTASVEIRQALIHSLLHDENPGVRVGAVEALRELAGDAQVRQALQQALLGDTNAGIRVAAIEGLRSFRDQATLRVLERMEVDDNEYVRAEARRALERHRSAAFVQPPASAQQL